MIAEDLQALARPIDSLRTMEGNPRRGDIKAVMRSYEQFGQRKPIVALRDGTVIAGNHQLMAARELGWAEIAVVFVDDDPTTAKAFSLADNRISDLGGYDPLDLDAMLADIRLDPVLFEATGYSPDLSVFDGLGQQMSGVSGEILAPAEQPGPLEPDAPRPTLADRFVFPPFSVLDQRSGPWQERKRRWLAYGIRSEVGRGDNLLQFSDTILGLNEQNRAGSGALTLPSLSGRVPDYYQQKTDAEQALGRALSNDEFERDFLQITGETENLSTGGTSIFDPVLCELVYRWFSPAGGLVLDPFAGGSVRGIMAALLGRRYVGVDLRAEQTEANRAQADEILSGSKPEWITGDSRSVLSTLSLPGPADLMFSCPPYADLEVYSDDPADISNMKYPEFLEAYREIIQQGVDLLADDRFAVFVVGDVRDSKGIYYNLIGDTVRAFRDAGCDFYNEAILVNSVGSLAVRVGRQFTASRKLGKLHQNVLVFCKGDGKRAAQACGEMEVALPGEEATL